MYDPTLYLASSKEPKLQRLTSAPKPPRHVRNLLLGVIFAIPAGVIIGLMFSSNGFPQQPLPVTPQLAHDDCDSLYQQGYIDWPLVPGSDTETVDNFSLNDVMPEGTRYKRIRMTTIYKQKPECSQDRAKRLDQQKQSQ